MKIHVFQVHVDHTVTRQEPSETYIIVHVSQIWGSLPTCTSESMVNSDYLWDCINWKRQDPCPELCGVNVVSKATYLFILQDSLEIHSLVQVDHTYKCYQQAYQYPQCQYHHHHQDYIQSYLDWISRCCHWGHEERKRFPPLNNTRFSKGGMKRATCQCQCLSVLTLSSLISVKAIYLNFTLWVNQSPIWNRII